MTWVGLLNRYLGTYDANKPFLCIPTRFRNSIFWFCSNSPASFKSLRLFISLFEYLRPMYVFIKTTCEKLFSFEICRIEFWESYWVRFHDENPKKKKNPDHDIGRAVTEVMLRLVHGRLLPISMEYRCLFRVQWPNL